MKAIFLIASALMGAEPDARVLRLLTEDAQVITGIDWERYAGSRLASRFPLYNALLQNGSPAVPKVTQMILIGTLDAPLLTLYFGEFGVLPAPEPGESSRFASPERGVLFEGSPEWLPAVIAAWRAPSAEVPAWASRLQELGRDYDNWTFIRSPLPPGGKGIAPAPRPRWDELRKRVVDISLGIRLGARHECFAQATLASFDDAGAAASLARWLPAFAEADGGSHSDLISQAENFEARQNGTRVEIRFSLADDKIPVWGIRAQ